MTQCGSTRRPDVVQAVAETSAHDDEAIAYIDTFDGAPGIDIPDLVVGDDRPRQVSD